MPDSESSLLEHTLKCVNAEHQIESLDASETMKQVQ